MLTTRFFRPFSKYILAALVGVLSLSACGYRGALYLPSETEEKAPTMPSDAAKGQTNEAAQSSEDEPN